MTLTLRVYGFLSLLAFTSIEAVGQDQSLTLHTALWNLDVVHEAAISIENDLGEDPKELIDLPTLSNWSARLVDGNTREVAISVPNWFVLDGSGMRGSAHFSVWCDEGKLFQDTIMVLDLKKSDGNAEVEWSFDGKSWSKSNWIQKGNFVMPANDFDHDSFVRKYAKSRFLILKIKGAKGLVEYDTRKERKEKYALVPLSLEGNKKELVKLIDGCKGSDDTKQSQED